jgi:hypothetical protein
MLNYADEKRSETRRTMLRGGRIVFNNGHSTIDCTIRNVSSAGAKLVVTSPLGIPESFVLMFDTKEKRPARVVWRTTKEVGVAFETLH